jgi:hypothetical protein
MSGDEDRWRRPRDVRDPEVIPNLSANLAPEAGVGLQLSEDASLMSGWDVGGPPQECRVRAQETLAPGDRPDCFEDAGQDVASQVISTNLGNIRAKSRRQPPFKKTPRATRMPGVGVALAELGFDAVHGAVSPAESTGSSRTSTPRAAR